jgi:MFS family permease
LLVPDQEQVAPLKGKISLEQHEPLRERGQGGQGHYRYLICLVVSAAFFLSLFHRFAPAAIAVDLLNSFNASAAFLGILGSAYFYPYAFMQLPSGILADSWGPRKSISFFLIIAALGSILMGLSPNIGIAILGRVLVGLGVSTLFVCNFKLLTEWFNPREFAILGGLLMTVAGLGSFASSVPLAWLSGLIGWRMTLILVGFVTLGIVALIYLVVRDRPADMGRRVAHSPFQDSPMEARRGLLGGIREIIASKDFWPVPVWTFFGSGIFFSLAALWGGPYLIHVYGLTRTEAGAVLSMFAVGLIVGGPVQGVCSNTFGRRPVLVAASLVMLLISSVFFVFTDGLPLYLIYLLFFGIAFSIGSTGSLQATICKEMFPPAIAGTAMGAGNFFTMLGGACWQVLMGIAVTLGEKNVTNVYPVSGYRRIFLMCVIAGVISVGSALCLRETLPRKVEGDQ